MDTPAILAKRPKVKLNESTEVEMQPLTLDHVFDVMDMVIELLEKGQEDSLKQKFSDSLEQQFGAILFLGLRHCRDRVMSFLGSLIGQQPQEFRRQPLPVTGQVIKGLISHPDLAHFLADLKETFQSEKVASLLGSFLTEPSSTSSENSTSATNK